jgi:hypothetical protein
LTLGAYRLILLFPFLVFPLLLVWVFFFSFDQWKFEVYFVWDKYCYYCLFSGAVGLVNLLPVFHPKPVLVSANEIGLL